MSILGCCFSCFWPVLVDGNEEVPEGYESPDDQVNPEDEKFARSQSDKGTVLTHQCSESPFSYEINNPMPPGCKNGAIVLVHTCKKSGKTESISLNDSSQIKLSLKQVE